MGIKHMNDFATELMKDVLDAYAQRGVERARDIGSGMPSWMRWRIRCSAIS